MNTSSETDRRRSRRRLRATIWGTAASLLLLPLLAMQISDEVNWGAADFIVFGAMLVGAGCIYELAAASAVNVAYRGAVGVAVAAAFLLVWMNLAVGVIGTEGNPANLMFGGVLAVGAVGAALARLQPYGMARALFAMACAQGLVAVIAVVLGLGVPASGPVEILALNGLFAALWLLSAWLFRRAGVEVRRRGRGPEA
jgi:hypothetical protein